MKCPKCKNAELKKNTPNSPYLCTQCAGVWLLNAKSTDLHALAIDQAETEGDTNENDHRTGVCPSGHGILIRAKVDIDEPFYLERCTSCGGIWFDKGEWTRIAENNLTENLDNIWSKSWQRKQSIEKDRESFLKLNRKLLGDRIFDSVMDLVSELKEHPQKNRAVALLQREIL